MDNNELMFRDNWEKMDIPSNVQVDRSTLTEGYGKFTLDPLYKGFGITIGHAMRRVLLSSLQGSAVYAVKMEGVSHEYETIKGVREDVLQIILNLKELKLKQVVDNEVVFELIQKGPKVVTAADINTFGKVEVMNPDQVICHVDEDAEINMSIYVRMNRGFISAEDNFEEDMPIGTIFLDSKHSPIEKVHYEVQNTRVGQKTDYDKLLFELWTNGGVLPDEAMAYGAKILKEYFTAFITFDEESIKEEVVEEEVEQTYENPNLYRSVNELELSVRSINCLQNAKIETIGELVQKTEAEMLKTKNFGRKSLQEIKTILAGMGLTLGMKLDSFDNPQRSAEN